MADDASPLNAISEKRSPERSLLDHVGRVAHNRAGRFAVQIHLSKLKPHNRQPHHVRIASRSFDSLLNAADVQLYVLTTGDLVLMCRNVRVDEVDAMVERLRSLFRADPLAARGRLADGTEFTSWFDFEVDFEAFADLVRNLDAASRRARPGRSEDASAGTGQDSSYSGKALDPFALASVDDSLQRLRIGDMLREQPAVIIGADGTEHILFMEKYVSISDLQKQIAAEYNLLSNPWLFQQLTETLDRRVLVGLSRENFAELPYDISINLNIKTILSRDFQRFDEMVADATPRLLIELQQIDVFSDIASYTSARTFLKDRGYRVVIDGLNPLSLQFYNPGLLDGDFYKVAWTMHYTDMESAEDHAELGGLVETIGSDRFILARTDTESAVRWALTLGIRRFQGFFIDLLVKKQSEKRGGARMPSAHRTRAADKR